MPSHKHTIVTAVLMGVAMFVMLALSATHGPGLEARFLSGDEFLRLQVESDFDRDGDVDFLDFTVFSAFYEEAV